MTTIRLMTFNVRGAPETDGVNIWANRAALTVETIRASAPDLIGFQEVQAENLATFRVKLKDYDYVLGPLSNRPDRILFNAIFWNPKTLSQAASGGFYLSRTPHRWSLDWDSARVRVLTWVRLRLVESDLELLHLNTHLDHIGSQARAQGSHAIVRNLRDIDSGSLPVVLTGDFNSAPQATSADSHSDVERPYRVFQEAGFVDAYRAFNPLNDKEENTFHGFKGKEFSGNGDLSAWRIDWILVRSGARSINVKSCAIVRHAFPPLYPSDHYPVVADLQID